MSGNLVDASDAFRNRHYTDPASGQPVVLCRGAIRDPYFARKSDFDRRLFFCRDNVMSEWHLAKQSAFPPECTEISIRFRNQIYRADAILNGVEFEMQHSPMTALEFRSRNAFYLSQPEIDQVVWIFDYNSHDITPLEPVPQHPVAYRWRRQASTCRGFVPPQGDGLSLLNPNFDSLFSDPNPADALASQLARQRELTGSSNVEIFFEFSGILHRVLSCGTAPTLPRSEVRKKTLRHESSWRECDASGDFSDYWNDWSSFTADSSIPSIEDLVDLVSKLGHAWNRR